MLPNKRRAWKIWQKIKVSCNEKTGKNFRFFIINLINVGHFNKAVGPRKKSKINERRAYVYSGV